MAARRALVRFLRDLKSAVEREDWAAAAASAQAMIEADPDSAEAHFGLALASIYLDDLATALRAPGAPTKSSSALATTTTCWRSSTPSAAT